MLSVKVFVERCECSFKPGSPGVVTVTLIKLYNCTALYLYDFDLTRFPLYKYFRIPTLLIMEKQGSGFGMASGLVSRKGVRL